MPWSPTTDLPGCQQGFRVGPTWAFKDAGATVPCAVGDAIAAYRDESLTKICLPKTAGVGGVLRQDANGFYYAECDPSVGLRPALGALTSGAQCIGFVARQTDSAGTVSTIIEGSTVFSFGGLAWGADIFFCGGVISSDAIADDGNPHYQLMRKAGSGGDWDLRRDGVARTVSAGNTTDFGELALGSGGIAGVGGTFALYGWAAGASKPIGSDLTSFEAWMASLFTPAAPTGNRRRRVITCHS